MGITWLLAVAPTWLHGWAAISRAGTRLASGLFGLKPALSIRAETH